MPTTLTPNHLPSLGEDEPLRISYGRDILVVDDNQTNLIAIEAALSPLGRKLVLAHSGIEALGRLLDHAGIVRAGGAGSLELAWVAAGRVDAWAQPNVSDWDWFPGAALVRHAGGTAKVLDGDPAWHVAGAPALVAELEKLVPRA
jgi:fructose-1,6-bisphosphatase/inositol monophosphatase family enzyme